VREVLAMVVSRVFAAASLLSLLIPVSAHAQQQQIEPRDVTEVPTNVEAGVFADEMISLMRRSHTFREQCARIAADDRVRVRFSVSNSIDGGGRAQTTFRRDRGATLLADVEILFGANYRELLAHEFEHVIEQLDGVNLRQEAAEGRAWRVAAGAFETRRASLVGVKVLREAAALPSQPAITAQALR
jgi:hypothetical protein